MSILDKINCSNDVKKLSAVEVHELCGELRNEILNDVSKTGGHLASNLGAVELTVALHRVYDSTTDRIVFDVGHQCYAHKMLTGRRWQFNTLRQLNGLSGFPKPAESHDDACIAGHASAAISNALGLARARTINKQHHNVVAVLGDGALTGGLAYEGLCDCATSGEPILVILNDNSMSIACNVGGTACNLAHLRVRPGYIAFKRFYHRTIGKCKGLYSVLHVIKEWAKHLILPSNMFEDMGFYYLGPIDGHDVKTLERTITYAKEMSCPVLLHILTKKGKGYPPAEKDPERYHGVSPFNIETGIPDETSSSFSSVFGEELSSLADSDIKIVAITAAMTSGTGLGTYAHNHPDRFFDVGIAEGHAVSLAAGLAGGGAKPVFAVYSTFLQRALDMMIHDVSLAHLPVTFAVDRAGLVGADGETHQGCFDVGYLRLVPGITIYSPSDYAELRSMLRLALNTNGPAAIRYPRGKEGAFTADTSSEPTSVISAGDNITLVSYGTTINDLISAGKKLASIGITADIIKINRLSNPDFEPIRRSIEKTNNIIIVEETADTGCMGHWILAEASKSAISLVGSKLLNLGNGIVRHGTPEQLRKLCGIDSESIVHSAKLLLNKEAL